MAARSRFAIYPSLEDKVVVISGGANGIGSSLVEQFALQGSQVVFLDIADEAANALVDKIVALKVKHKPAFYHCDLLDIQNGLKPTAAKILEQHPKVHGLINNAAGSPSNARQTTMDVTPETWNFGIGVNLSHQFFLTQALLPGLIAAETSSIINMGSIIWKVPLTGTITYSTCKAAVVGLTRTLAHEFGPQGVRVNCVMPGSVATEAEKRDVLTPEYKALVLGRQALKKLTEPEDIARTTLWLIADDSGAVTNQNIIVDAGWV